MKNWNFLSYRFYRNFSQNCFTNDDRAAEFLDWMEKLDNSIQCSDTWFDVSARGITQYTTCDGDLLLNWKKRGYKTLFELLMVIKFFNQINNMSVNFQPIRIFIGGFFFVFSSTLIQMLPRDLL